MITNKLGIDEVYFSCDFCGKTYNFSGSYLIARKGDQYRTAGGELLTAPCDLCRDCAGQTEKFAPGAEAQLQGDISVIDAATAAL